MAVEDPSPGPAGAALPNPLSAPMALQTIRYGLDPEGFFTRSQRRFGSVFTVRVLRETWVILSDPAAIKEAFALGPEEANSGEANFALRPLIGTRNVLLLDGDEHLSRRKLLLPPFHGDRMRAYEESIREAVAAQVAEMPAGKSVSMLPRMQSLTFSVILQCVFGIRDRERLQRVGDAFRQMLTWITDTRRGLQYATLGPERLMRLPSFRRQLAEVDRNLLTEIRERRAEDLSGRDDILSMLVEARDEEGDGLSDAELRDELATMLVAGHETTAALLSWTIHELARDEESQERLAGGEAGFGTAVVTEALRLRPPVPIVLRRLRDTSTIAGHDLPAGTTVAPCTLLVHRDPALYPEPWAFRPARFLDRKPVRSEWFPFGGSVRRCIGAAFAQFEARIVLEELARSLRFSPGSARAERVGRRGPVLVPSRGARVVVSKR
jgi:cytochrome P450 family 135